MKLGMFDVLDVLVRFVLVLSGSVVCQLTTSVCLFYLLLLIENVFVIVLRVQLLRQTRLIIR